MMDKNTTLLDGKATQRAMAGPEILRNKANIDPPSDAAQPDWQIVSHLARQRFPHHTDGAIRGIQLVASFSTEELAVLFKDATKREALRLQLGKDTNPNWIDGQVAEELYNRGKIDDEELGRGCTDDAHPEDAQPARLDHQMLRGDIERALVLVRRHVLPADLPNAENHLRCAIKGLDFLDGLRANPEDAPEGPWRADKMIGGWAVWIHGVTTHTIEFRGTEVQCKGVRDVLNRLKGDEK